jgi:hypothetical protein
MPTDHSLVGFISASVTQHFALDDWLLRTCRFQHTLDRNLMNMSASLRRDYFGMSSKKRIDTNFLGLDPVYNC